MNGSTSSASSGDRTGTAGDDRRHAPAAALADLVCIVVFVVIGRSSHHHGEAVAGIISTSWPFVVGAACGWVIGRAWTRPLRLMPSGVIIWATCVALGMVLRVVSGQGTAAAFVVVALAFLGVELLGWRAVVRGAALRHARPDRTP